MLRAYYISLGVLFFGTSSHAATDLMASLGDSLSAGTFAQTQAHSAGNRIMGIFPPYPEIPWLIQNKKTYAWPSGKKIKSHIVRLREYYKQAYPTDTVAVLNVAMPGGSTNLLPQQALRVAKEMESGKYRTLRYVTLLIGGNDACDVGSELEIPARLFETYLMETLEILNGIRQNEPIHVLISTVPKIPSIGRPEILESTTWFGLKCGYVRKKLITYCSSLTLWSTESDYRKRVGVIEAKNTALRQLARDASKLRNLDIVFSESLFQFEFQGDDLAFDCFHPSFLGQEKISELLWNDQPWFH